MIGLEVELGAVFLLFAETIKAVHFGFAMGAVKPFTAGSPFELRRIGVIGERLFGLEQCLYIDAIVYGRCCFCHGCFLLVVLCQEL